MPHLPHFFVFREEAMAPEIEGEAFVVFGGGQAARLVPSFEDEGMATKLGQLIGRSQSCGPASDDYNGLIVYHRRSQPCIIRLLR